jgi:PAT family beta-lactamase induction signal transducer AmpG
MYKIGDTMAAAMTTPFYLDVGFTKDPDRHRGQIVRISGPPSAEPSFGGIAMIRLGIIHGLWIFGHLAGPLHRRIRAAGDSLGPHLWALSAVIAFENLSGGMGTAAYAAYMASITDKRFTATQYALLTSLMGVPRVLASAPTGYLATRMGWEVFFIFCTLIALPGLLLIFRLGGNRK